MGVRCPKGNLFSAIYSNMKCSEENVILRGIVHVVSCFHCISCYIAEIWITFRTVCGEGRQVWLYPTWYSKWLDSIPAWGPCRLTLPVPIRALFSLLNYLSVQDRFLIQPVLTHLSLYLHWFNHPFALY